MKKFRWAFVGASTIAFNVAKVIYPTGRHEVVGIWNRTIQKAIDFQAVYGSKVYCSLDELLNDSSIDAIYVALTTNIHKEIVLKALEHKIPVLVEKPFSVNHHEAIEMFDYAKKQNTYLCEAMWTWFNDTALTVKSWIDEGFVGEIENVKIDYALPLIHYLKSTRLLDIKRCGGALMDIGVYPIHYAVELFGKPESVTAINGLVIDGVDHKVDVVLSYKSFQVNIRIAMDRYEGERFTVYGTNGYIRVPWFHMSSHASACSKDRIRRKFNDKNGYRNDLLVIEFDRVSEEIKEGKVASRYVSPQSIIETFEIMDEIRKQIGVVFPQDYLSE